MSVSQYSLPAGSSFEQWWQLQGEWVEAPNQRRGGASGVQRVAAAQGLCYAKRQTGHLYRSPLYPFGRPTVLRERDALLALARLGVGVPRLVYCGAEHCPQEGWRGLLVTEALEGFEDIDSFYARGGRERHDQAVQRRLLQAIGRMLARMHLGRWQHGCLYAKHVFVRVVGAEVEVALLDLEKSRRRLNRRRLVRHDLRQLRRHSPWNDREWQQLLQGYRQQYGRALPELD